MTFELEVEQNDLRTKAFRPFWYKKSHCKGPSDSLGFSLFLLTLTTDTNNTTASQLFLAEANRNRKPNNLCAISFDLRTEQHFSVTYELNALHVPWRIPVRDKSPHSIRRATFSPDNNGYLPLITVGIHRPHISRNGLYASKQILSFIFR